MSKSLDVYWHCKTADGLTAHWSHLSHLPFLEMFLPHPELQAEHAGHQRPIATTRVLGNITTLESFRSK